MHGECHDTGKLRFATARAAHLAVRQAYWGRRTKKQPRRVYYCDCCQGYHLTSQLDLAARPRPRFTFSRQQHRYGAASHGEVVLSTSR